MYWGTCKAGPNSGRNANGNLSAVWVPGAVRTAMKRLRSSQMTRSACPPRKPLLTARCKQSVCDVAGYSIRGVIAACRHSVDSLLFSPPPINPMLPCRLALVATDATAKPVPHL